MKIVGKRPVGIHKVFDLTVKDTENFVAEDVVVHNCGAQNFVKDFNPRSVYEIAVATSIYRPGPLNAKVDRIYLEAKKNPEAVVYEHPLVKEVLEPTYGCLVGDTLVTTEKGSLRIEDIADQQMVGLNVLSLNEKTDCVEQDEIVAAVCTGIQDIFEVELEDGKCLRLTGNHQVFTQRGWVACEDLTDVDVLYEISD